MGRFLKKIVVWLWCLVSVTVICNVCQRNCLLFSTVLKWWPFTIKYLRLKLELTSDTDILKNDDGEELSCTFRPDFKYFDPGLKKDGTMVDVNGGPCSFVCVKNLTHSADRNDVDLTELEDELDHLGKYDLVSPIPVVYGEIQRKQTKIAGGSLGACVEYSPILHMGFFVKEPLTAGLYNFAFPAILTVLLMILTMYEFRQTKGAMGGESFLEIMAGLILTVVFLLPSLRQSESARSRTVCEPTDLMLMLLILGMAISCSSVFFVRSFGNGDVATGMQSDGMLALMYTGAFISLSSFLIPLSGGFVYMNYSRKIKSRANVGLIETKEATKRQGEAFPPMQHIHPFPEREVKDTNDGSAGKTFNASGKAWGWRPDLDKKGRRGGSCLCC